MASSPNLLNPLTAEEKQNFHNRIFEAGNQLQRYAKPQDPDPDPKEIERLDHARKQICNEYLLRLIDIYAFEGKTRLPYVAYMDTKLYQKAQDELGTRLEALGITPKDHGFVLQDSFFAGLRRDSVENSHPMPPKVTVYAAGDGKYEFKEGRHSKPFYKLKCGPKLCRTEGVDSCEHGLLIWTGGPPNRWKTGLGWENGNPFQGRYEGDSLPQDLEGNLEVEKMDFDD